MGIKVDSILVHRGLILGNLKALLFTMHQMFNNGKEDSFNAGYREGYQDAIFAIAQAVQVEQELLDSMNAIPTNILLANINGGGN